MPPSPPLIVELLIFCIVGALTLIWLRIYRARWVLFKRRFEQETEAHLDRTHLFIDPARLLWIYCLLVASSTVLTFVLSRSLAGSIAMALLLAWAPAWCLGWLERRRRARIGAQLPELFSRLASLLRSGMGVNLAIEHLSRQMPAPLGHELRQLQRERRLGVGLAVAVKSLSERVPLRSLGLFSCLIELSHAQGGGLAQAMAGLAEQSRRHLMLEAKCLALTAQARLQARVMCAIPLFVAAMIFLLDPSLVSDAMSHPSGKLTLATVLVLEVAGLRWVARIARS